MKENWYHRHVLPYIIDYVCRNLQTMYLPGPRLFSYNYWGEAFMADGQAL